VVTTQVLRAGQLPALVSQFHRGDLAIHREEKWTPVLDGIANAVITGSISGAPVSVTGQGALTPRWILAPASPLTPTSRCGCHL